MEEQFVVNTIVVYPNPTSYIGAGGWGDDRIA